MEKKEKIDVGRALAVGGLNALTSVAALGISSMAGKEVTRIVKKTPKTLLDLIKPEFMPAWSWIWQSILTWTFPFFSGIPTFFK